MPLRPKLRDGVKVPIDTEDYVKLPVEGVLIGTMHIIMNIKYLVYIFVRIGERGQGILLPPPVAGAAGWTLENVITDAFFRIIRWRLKNFHE